MNFNIEGLLHGGDYNPEQWLDAPEILAKDIQYMKKSKNKYCNPGRIFLGGSGAGRRCLSVSVDGRNH